MKTQSSVIKTAIMSMAVALYMASETARAGRQLGEEVLGGYTAITDLDDEHVQDIAKYAVTEHNHKAGTNLEYLKVVRGEYQVAAGNNYRLLISTKDEGVADNDGGDGVRNFEAVVNDRPWEISRTLTSFNKAT
ncbi:hypothetical protein vseg_017348 [Gypsophila vaccaria]